MSSASAPRSIVPRVAFGFNSTLSMPVVALEQESLTYISCCGSRTAFVSAEEIGGENLSEGSSKPMHFFPPIKVQAIAARVVTAVAFHKQRKLLALCVAQLPRNSPAAVVVYSLGMFTGAWVPTVLETLRWDKGDPSEEFGIAEFSADASTIVAVTKSSSSVAVGFEWQSRTLAFASSLNAHVENICCHPSDVLELSTSGPEHVQLWRLLHKELKSRNAVKYLPYVGTHYTQHEWLSSEMLVAGTSSGDVAIIQQNEQTQRFEGVHLASVRGVVPLEHGFATVCSACGVCVFQRDDDPRQKKSGKVGVKLMRRITLDGVRSIESVSNFPGQTASATLLVCKHAVAVLDLPQLLLTTDQNTKRFPAKRLGVPHHEGNIVSLSAAVAKPLLASCSTIGNSVCIWDWRTRELAVRYMGDEAFQKQTLVCLDMHPSGYQILVGLEDEMRLYHLGHRDLFLVQKIATKGVVSLKRDDSPLVSTTPLSLVKYSNGGHLFAAVMGRLIQIFDSHSQEESGRAGLVHALRGHAGNVKGLVWGVDDQRLFTVSEDGAVYEWSIGAFEDRGKLLSRTRDCVRLGIKWSTIAMFGDGALVAAGAPRDALQKGKQKDDENFTEEPVICIWPGNIDLFSVDVFTGDTTITTILPLDPAGDCQGMLIAGTSRGSVLSGPWPLLDDNGDPIDLRELPLCDGPIVALTFSRRDNTLCAAGLGGSILICCAGRDGFFGQRQTIKQNTAIGPSDEMVLIERGAFYKLEANVRTLIAQLEQTKAAAKQQQDEAQPEFERQLQEQQEDYDLQVETLEQALEDLGKKLNIVKDRNASVLAGTRSTFEQDVKELESLYDKKLATEAARYMEIRDEIDKIRLDARDELEQQVLDSRKSEEKWKKSKEILKQKYETETKLLQEYAAQGKHQALKLLEEQDKQSDVKIFEAREESTSEISDLHRKLTTSLHDKAVLKRRNEQLSMDYHKNRDELTESQQSYYAARDRADDAEDRLSSVLHDLKCESELRAKHEEVAHAQARRLEDSQRWKKMLSEQKDNLNITILKKDASLATLNKKWQRLDAILEDAGQQNKIMGITLNRKANELQRARQRVGECRKHIFSKDKRLGSLVEQIDVFLLRLRDPAIRPQPVVLAELNQIRDAVVRLQPARHRAEPLDAGEGIEGNNEDEEDTHPRRARVKTIAVGVGADKTPRERMIDQLRTQNLELMEELNDLRFDRKCLHRKLRDEKFNFKWGKRNVMSTIIDIKLGVNHPPSMPELVPLHAQTQLDDRLFEINARDSGEK